ncbi:alpha-mannosidase [Streptomyces sp. NEAU-H3]|uniref:alpha-mannosidase n=1 Tax=Streptomyces sp. NEAU-H3 TaxID=2720636 RepID=UPI0035B61A9C
MVSLLEEAPEFVFAMSQAQQWAWLKEHRPEVWRKVVEAVADGRFVPAGGMWVESDTNMPGSEAMARQFVHGKRFFLDEFGVDNDEAWLPDTFGFAAGLPQIIKAAGSKYLLTQKSSWSKVNNFPHHTFGFAAGLPQIIKAAGSKYLLTQKISWSKVNNFPHHTFGFAAGLPQIIQAAGSKYLLTQKSSWSKVNNFPHDTFRWEGIDGTRIFTHFPPVDSYNCEMLGSQLGHAARNFKEKGRATRSLAPTGFGDGGGGTTREMVAKAARLKNTEGPARVDWETPSTFFAKAEAEYPEPPVWVGELYLELHRATLTSQAKTKQGNRRGEHLLREAELWSATAAVRAGFPYPYDRLDRLWKTLLLHQFHDILPGSSIAWVHRQAERTYAGLAGELREIIGAAQQALAGEGDTEVRFNSAPHADAGIAAGAAGTAPAPAVVAPVARTGGGFVLDNGVVRIEIDARGLVVSALRHDSGREAVAPGQAANLLQLHTDFPNQWDAWDVDSFYRNTVTDLTDVEELSAAPEGVRIVRAFGDSRVVQTLSLAEGAARLDIDTEVDWHETEKFLKLAFPLDVHAERYASETQFGHFYRPTHTNTTWETAKFEACNHRFVHLGEPGFGVAVVNDSTYGHDVSRTVRADGGTTTTVRASLLRAPRFPDPETDQGVHRFRHGLVAGATIDDAVREGWRVNLPRRVVRGAAAEIAPLVTVGQDSVVVTAVKLADDGSGDVVVRFHEARGGRTVASLRPGFEVAEVLVTDLLERDLSEGAAEVVAVEGELRVALRPFQLVTLRLRRG